MGKERQNRRDQHMGRDQKRVEATKVDGQKRKKGGGGEKGVEREGLEGGEIRRRKQHQRGEER